MTLPFQKFDGKRRWACFVCGREFESYEEFTQHIGEVHREGRDFVICPLDRCKAPVRDMRSHFKAKHPRDKIPPGTPNKATVWRDKTKGGKMKARKPNFVSGTMISDKNDGAEIGYRSGLERDVFSCLEQLNDVVKYEVESLRILYQFEGEQRTYIPDVVVHFKDGRTELWEIKPSSQTTMPQNHAKWHAAAQYCRDRQWEPQVAVITELGLGRLQASVRQQIINEYDSIGKTPPQSL